MSKEFRDYREGENISKPLSVFDYDKISDQKISEEFRDRFKIWDQMKYERYNCP